MKNTKRYEPGCPPKDYKARRSIGLFECSALRQECTETLRVTLNRKGDIYVFHPDQHRDFHVSHHASGSCHWKDQGSYIIPRDGHEDYANAMAVKHLLDFDRGVPCFCLRRGTRLSRAGIRVLLSRLEEYLPGRFDMDDIAGSLSEKGSAMFITPGGRRLLSEKR